MITKEAAQQQLQALLQRVEHLIESNPFMKLRSSSTVGYTNVDNFILGNRVSFNGALIAQVQQMRQLLSVEASELSANLNDQFELLNVEKVNLDQHFFIQNKELTRYINDLTPNNYKFFLQNIYRGEAAFRLNVMVFCLKFTKIYQDLLPMLSSFDDKQMLALESKISGLKAGVELLEDSVKLYNEFNPLLKNFVSEYDKTIAEIDKENALKSYVQQKAKEEALQRRPKIIQAEQAAIKWDRRRKTLTEEELQQLTKLGEQIASSFAPQKEEFIKKFTQLHDAFVKPKTDFNLFMIKMEQYQVRLEENVSHSSDYAAISAIAAEQIRCLKQLQNNYFVKRSIDRDLFKQQCEVAVFKALPFLNILQGNYERLSALAASDSAYAKEYKEAEGTAFTLIQSLQEIEKEFFVEKSIDLATCLKRCKEAIELARPVLATHRSWFRPFAVLAFLAASVFTLGLVPLVSYLQTGDAYYYFRTTSEQNLNAYAKKLSQFSLFTAEPKPKSIVMEEEIKFDEEDPAPLTANVH
ncbi:hypothetical protein [Legionella septentrionalis]|uniref:hypothetical protein n=1 Tax=Legionella septentrionalis TaxID=2498109 RepID=UPI000F8C775F|nr:hypothetical protein [Legionella septentrionalis]RUR15137.1 hypothetical protein ELY10_06815 [Legionella septentrionalis]